VIALLRVTAGPEPSAVVLRHVAARRAGDQQMRGS
jgi:hypothetical protein